jgi:16S rRNA (cytosine967-C5)-methyltransferase
MRCLDVCAAPGGKTTVLWHDMRGDGLLVAADRRRARVRLLASTLRGAQVPTAVVALDAGAPLPFGAAFDRVLLDAPCSGLGTVRRDPDIKWVRTDADLLRFAETQRTMIGEAAGAVRPGGRLIYATCSSEPDENEDVVRAFLASDPRFVLAPPEVTSHDARRFVGQDGYLRTLPHRDGLDAFFAAVLVRSASA